MSSYRFLCRGRIATYNHALFEHDVSLLAGACQTLLVLLGESTTSSFRAVHPFRFLAPGALVDRIYFLFVSFGLTFAHHSPIRKQGSLVEVYPPIESRDTPDFREAH